MLPRSSRAPAPPLPLWACWLNLDPGSSTGKGGEVTMSFLSGPPTQARGWPLPDA